MDFTTVLFSLLEELFQGPGLHVLCDKNNSGLHIVLGLVIRLALIRPLFMELDNIRVIN